MREATYWSDAVWNCQVCGRERRGKRPDVRWTTRERRGKVRGAIMFLCRRCSDAHDRANITDSGWSPMWPVSESGETDRTGDGTSFVRSMRLYSVRVVGRAEMDDDGKVYWHLDERAQIIPRHEVGSISEGKRLCCRAMRERVRELADRCEPAR